ncbi:MAG TPA: iron-sulfur cluster biosynthesis family protein [Thermoplasmata archaeon]|nr:iron-sulfur cluster biosynthesis family protein [Thermoplasmata archaeon]
MSDSGIKLEVTQEAQDQVRGLMKSQKPGMAVRVYLQSGGGGGGGGCGSGCSCGSGGGCGSEGGGGPSFGMAFDKPRNGDRVVQVDGFSIVVDDLSAEMLNGARIDYVQDLNASGFKIIPPNAPTSGEAPASEAGGCGCGSGGCGGG